MDLSRPIDTSKLLTLQETAQTLAVSIDVLLRWNESQILKPTITQTGQIGYTRDQISQFLAIQQSLRTGQPSASTPRANIQAASLPELISNTATHEKAKTGYFRIVSSSVVIVSIVAIAILAQQGQFDFLLGQYEKSYQNGSSGNVLGAQTSTAGITLANNTQDESGSALSAKPANTLSANNQHTPTVSNQGYQSPTASVAGAIKSQVAQKPSQSTPDNTITAGTTTLANVAVQNPEPANPNSLFDKSGNIVGKTDDARVLAMNIAGAGLLPNQESSTPTSTDTRNQLILAVISASGMALFLLRRPQKSIAVSHEIPVIPSFEKFLEVDQRMDGTIVLTLQGKDYKISKPELHSDSDRFFERLMEVVGDTAKEIEYDNYNDEKMKLTTPLSRLVTRLGFVGIKRDLFFPRTSKHNVLFRRYLTREDLLAMNISPNQVAKELVQSFQTNFSPAYTA